MFDHNLVVLFSCWMCAWVHLEYGSYVSDCTAFSTVYSWSQLLLKKYNTNMIPTAKKIPNKNAQHILRDKLKEKKKSKDLFIIVYLLMFSCALRISSKHHVFCCALISCGLFNYLALLVTLPQNISIISQAWTRLCILPSQTWDYYLVYFAAQETEWQNFAPDTGYINKHLGLETAKHPHTCCPGTDIRFPCFRQIYKYPNFKHVF